MSGIIEPERLDEKKAEETEVIEIESEEDEDMLETESHGLRRLGKQSRRPRYLDDYILLSEEEGELLLMCLNDEPRDFEEAKEHKYFEEAKEHKVWVRVELLKLDF